MPMLAQTTDTRIFSAFAGDPEYRELLVMFAEALPSRRAELVELHRGGRYDDLRGKAHQLKGAGGGFGFQGLTDVARELEFACKDGNPQGIAAALQRTLDYIDRVAI